MLIGPGKMDLFDKNPGTRERTTQEAGTYICGDGGAVETGVSVRTVPTPPLGACDVLWASECRSFPSARPTTVFGGGIRAPSLAGPELDSFKLKPLGRFIFL